MLACSTSHSIEGFYRNYREVSGGYEISDIIIRSDSTCSVRHYSDQGDYDLYDEGCGSWILKDEELEITIFDTIPNSVEYIADTSHQLTLNLYTSSDCPLLATTLAINPLTGYPIFEVKLGSYKGQISPTYTSITLVPYPSFSGQNIEIKHDSMQVIVHGILEKANKKISTRTYNTKGKNLIQYCSVCSGIYRKTVFYRKKHFETLPID
jgi:hypothetical protein